MDATIKSLIAQANSKIGAGALINFSETPKNVETLCSSGSINLDLALGIGGIARGRIYEIKGPESSGKTTLALHCIANTQKKGGVAAFIDAEHAFDPIYAENLGIDMDNLLFSQPDFGEQGLDIAEFLVDTGKVDLIVIDSVAALTPKAEIDGEMGELKVGLMARIMSQALRKLVGKCSKTGTTIIFINQIRLKIGVLYGNPETSPGGEALKFYCSVRLDIRQISKNEGSDSTTDNKSYISNSVRVKVIKNKLAPPFKEAEFDIVYGKGISKESEYLSAGLKIGVLKKENSGIFFSFDTPLFPEDTPLETSESKLLSVIDSEEYKNVKLELTTRVEEKLGQISDSEVEERLGELYKKGYRNREIVKFLFENGNSFSSSSKVLEAYYCFNEALKLSPMARDIKNKSKIISKRVKEQSKAKKIELKEYIMLPKVYSHYEEVEDVFNLPSNMSDMLEEIETKMDYSLLEQL